MFLRFIQLHALCAYSLFVLACGSVESATPIDEPVPRASLTHDIELPLETRVVEAAVPRGSTLASLFDDHSLADETVALVDAVREVFDPRRLRVGYPYRMLFGRDRGDLRRFEYHIDEDEFLRVAPNSTGYVAERVPYVKEIMEVSTRGRIDAANNSLVAALDAGGENVLLAVQMAEVFSGEIDFNNDLRRGDNFEVIFEKVYREGEFSSYGDVLAATFENDGRRVQAFRFHVPGEPEAQYFDENGRSMKRLFLRSPFRFEPRVTSRFSYRRVHPILGGVRPHLGVDYGAPTGTPVIAVANGTVVSVGMSGGSGNMVRLRHTNGYETYYLHLSAFAKGVRQGGRVTQGQVIGRVGSTGLSTGPHLDYRMRKNGEFVNPLLEHRNLPPGDPVPDEHMDAFHLYQESARERLSASVGSESALALTQ